MCQWGPSNCTRSDGVEVRELTQEMIDEIVAAYGKVADLAKRAGFEMLMIHGGHGWLINQFLSPYFNHRTDNYGGSIENRCHFAREVLQYADIHTGYMRTEIKANGIVCKDKDGNIKEFSGKTIICALGQRSRSEMVEELEGLVPYTAVIGDAVKVSTITQAVYLGYHAALDI